MNKLVEIVIPAHNEEYNIPVIYSAISAALADTNFSFKVLFVDDGSTDGTLDAIQDLSNHHDNVFYISLSRNFGHQNALKAGLDASSAGIVIMMDADMQHPPSLIPSLLKAHEEGFDVVYTVRKDNEHISFVKKHTANLFYKLMNYLSEIEIEPGSADFRLMNRKTLDALLLMPDKEIYAELHYLRSGRRKGHLYTKEDLENVKIKLLSLINNIIEDNNFTPTANVRACSYCDHAKSGACGTGVFRNKKAARA